ncbi:hypothetical protein [Halorubrum ezzemoulense]|uniref:hypothetical protein n=1 Tax=Halorubrum ezzemoulense TaxID=337243 RepID=UPI00232FDC82|nr:hypothetical protein [Halorubrum ezzemoulense]MDB2241846.1 hypothetical protein [Halorubrum ezzemoulense]MDB2283055.1 hypothetical protein [Halorubrum ezzemoulense]MDB9253410.1 hypothetical protein [Halorubrum ezzemoulense]MDB9254286.1 hypothetical protein [Halorubrum ezzemoulense]MDB9274997.1 hypothetical protein [Halorubrum ezzemoulense]
MSEFDWVDRDRGILTKRDRRFLRGDLEEELTDNEVNQKRYQIRQRFRNAMYDFHILYKALPLQDVNLLWDEIDNWIYLSEKARQKGNESQTFQTPLLARCWRDLISLFTYSQIITGVPEAESLVKWVVEEGVNKAVRDHTFDSYNMYREVDATLDWGVGESYKLMDYLKQLEDEVPSDPDEAEEYLLSLQRSGHLQAHHVTHLYEKCVESS